MMSARHAVTFALLASLGGAVVAVGACVGSDPQTTADTPDGLVPPGSPDGADSPDSAAAADSAGLLDAAKEAEAPVFSIASVAGLVLWLDAAKGVTDPMAVTKWLDPSGKSNDAFQVKGGMIFGPANIAPDGGVAVMRFDDRNPDQLRISDKASLQWSTGDFLLEVVASYNADPNAKQQLFAKLAGDGVTGPMLEANSPKDGSGMITASLDATHT